MKQMTIKWRQHELLLGGFITLFYILGIFAGAGRSSAGSLENLYELAFQQRQFPFNEFRNVMFPKFLLCVCLFLSLLFINLVLVRYVKERKYLALIVRSIFLFLVLGAGASIASYFFNQHLYYSPVSPNRNILRVVFDGYLSAARYLVLYGVYVLGRESLIPYLEREDPRRNFRVTITNRLTATTAIYFSILSAAAGLNIIENRSEYIGYAFFIPPAIISFFLALYWIFPQKGNRSIFKRDILFRLGLGMIAISIPCGIVFVAFLDEPTKFFPYFFFCSLLQIVGYGVAAIVYQQQKEKIEILRGLETQLGQSTAGLQFLRSQINPHFLFNALNTIYGMALQEKAERTAEGVQQLGDMMRFMLHENAKDQISLEKEIEYLENYISLQQLRTESSSGIKIERDIQTPPSMGQIAPMLLIPFVENAFKHGISLERPSFIKIMLRFKDNNLYFDVHNSIHHSLGMDTEKTKSGIGLQNVKQRLNLLYPGRHELIIHESASEFFVHLKINLT